MDTHTFTRRIPVDRPYDLVVAGGGPGGCGAAISAARLGARVLLAEGTGCLGGMGTAGLVSAWSDLGDGSLMIVGGIMDELLEQLQRRGGLRPGADPGEYRPRLHSGVGFNAEVLKRILDDLCREAGVEVRFFTRVIDVETDGLTVRGVVLNNVEGHRYIPARTVIDATGDAILVDLCGAPSRRAGRDTAKIMPPTLCAAVSGIDWSRFTYADQLRAVAAGVADGWFSQPDRHVPGLFQGGPGNGIMNAGHIFGMDALDCASLSEGMMRGRRLADEYVRFFRERLPGCESITCNATGSLLGVRESRRIVGEYELDYADFRARRTFPDQICVYNKSVDIHVYDCSDAEYARYHAEFTADDRPAAGEVYGLPYGILVPRGWSNLWVAGRCNSSDVKVHGAIRDQPACFMMGQAAGTAAVQAMRTGQTACDLDTAELVGTLRRAGAYLPQTGLSRTMTRKPSAT
ncbi:MAG: FAD-dependent oxidoreductase [Planctomycetes bacterium]|nr:FAD-dependent oxidoreductase [Planctomycetota bacterium]